VDLSEFFLITIFEKISSTSTTCEFLLWRSFTQKPLLYNATPIFSWSLLHAKYSIKFEIYLNFYFAAPYNKNSINISITLFQRKTDSTDLNELSCNYTGCNLYEVTIHILYNDVIHLTASTSEMKRHVSLIY